MDTYFTYSTKRHLGPMATAEDCCLLAERQLAKAVDCENRVGWRTKRQGVVRKSKAKEATTERKRNLLLRTRITHAQVCPFVCSKMQLKAGPPFDAYLSTSRLVCMVFYSLPSRTCREFCQETCLCCCSGEKPNSTSASFEVGLNQ